MKHKYTLLLFALCTLIIFIIGCRSHYPTTTSKAPAVKHAESLERGRNLTFNICGGCHYDHNTGKFTGKHLGELPKYAGVLYSANLTRSAKYGRPPLYTDAELVYLIKTGITRDGRFIPYMLRPAIADEDLNDIILFLRSDDASVTPGDTIQGLSHINLIGRMGMHLISKPQPFIEGTPRPSETDPVAYGRYLVAQIGCYHCHSQKSMSINYLHPEQTKGYLAGGAKFKTPAGSVRGANLTFDNATGIGSYSQSDFHKAVKEMTNKPGRHLLPPMESFPLNDNQVNAIYAYLKSLPPVHHAIRGRND